MAIRLYKACTPGTRHRVPPNLSSLNNGKPEKSLLKVKKKTGGRNNKGVITIRHRGGGHKQKYRLIDFKRNKYDVEGKVMSINKASDGFTAVCVTLTQIMANICMVMTHTFHI